MTTTVEEPLSLREDTRGAVMLTGVFMAFVLVGALWYVIGVGDAIIFRDRMQEAADHAVFSSAALHAKGMNFISAINIVMLILVIIHIIFGLIQDATILVCLAAGIGCLSCIAACPRIPGAIENFHSVSSKVKKGLTIMSSIETGIAIGAPWIGTAKGYGVGGEYKNGSGRVQGGVNVLTMGPSNLFVNGGKGIMGSSAVPVGLPVSGETYGFLCEFVAVKLASSIGEFIGIPYLSKILELVGKYAGIALKFRYCNDLGSGESFMESTKKSLENAKDELANGTKADEVANARGAQQAKANGQSSYQPILPGTGGRGDQAAADQVDTETDGGKRDKTKKVNGWSPYFDPGFDRGWGDPGVLVVIPSAGNGMQAQYVWSIAMNPKYRDTSEREVSTGANVKARAWRSDSDQGSSFIGWFAQAEFYYDCEEKWNTEECNGDDHFASFGIRWRARLRHVQLPNLIQVLTDLGANKLQSIIKNGVDKALEGNPIGEKLAKSKFGAVSIDVLGNYINNLVIRPIMSTIRNKTNGATDKLFQIESFH